MVQFYKLSDKLNQTRLALSKLGLPALSKLSTSTKLRQLLSKLGSVRPNQVLSIQTKHKLSSNLSELSELSKLSSVH